MNLKFMFWLAILTGGWWLFVAASELDKGNAGWALLMLVLVWWNARNAIRTGQVMALQNGKEGE